MGYLGLNIYHVLSGKGNWTTIIFDLKKPLLGEEFFLQTNLSDDNITCMIPIPVYRQTLKCCNESKKKPTSLKHYIEIFYGTIHV